MTPRLGRTRIERKKPVARFNPSIDSSIACRVLQWGGGERRGTLTSRGIEKRTLELIRGEIIAELFREKYVLFTLRFIIFFKYFRADLFENFESIKFSNEMSE